MQREDRESYTFASYVLYLWQKRFIILLGAVLCAGLMAVYVQFVAREKYRSYAQIMIKEPREIMGSEREALTPVSYEFLLLNEDLILQVRDEFAGKFNLSPAALRLEEFQTAFQVESEVVQDTTVKKQYTPVMVMSVDAGTPRHAKGLMEIWLKRFMERYGDIQARQADFTSRYYAEKADELQQTLAAKEERFLALRRQLPFKIRQLTAKEMMLSPAMVRLDYIDERRSYYKFRDDNRIKVSVPEPSVMFQEKGLEIKLVDIEIDLAAAMAENDNDKVLHLQEKKKALEKAIQNTKKQIDSLQRETASMEKEFQSLAREVTSLRDQYQYVMDLKNHTEVEAEGYYYSSKSNQDERSDITILAKPNLPEMRIFPKKTFSCLIAFLVGFVLTSLVVIFDKFMKDSRLLLLEGSKS